MTQINGWDRKEFSFLFGTESYEIAQSDRLLKLLFHFPHKYRSSGQANPGSSCGLGPYIQDLGQNVSQCGTPIQ
jgi:hypothetical protein